MMTSRRFLLPLAVLVAAGACTRPAPVSSARGDMPRAPATEPTAKAALAPAAPLAEPPLPALDTYSQRIQRLARLGRLWGVIRYLHPYLGYRAIDWDGAALEAIAKVGAAADTRAYIDAVSAMLAVLGDPVTWTYEDRPKKTEPRPLTHRLVQGDVLVVDMGTANSMAAFAAMQALAKELAKARAVIFDLRHVSREDAGWVSFLFPVIHARLTTEPAELPVERALFHSGYRPQTFRTSGGYFTAFMTTHAEVVEPEPGNGPERVVFMVGDTLALPEIAAALVASGKGAVVAPRARIDDRALASAIDVDLGEGWRARVRTTEALHRGAAFSLAAAAVVPDMSGGDESPAFRAALRLARTRSKRVPAPRPVSPPAARWRRDATYADPMLPGPAHRVLAAYRLWNVIHYFYPYLHLIGEWDGVLPLAIAELEAAMSAEDYARAVARVAARIADTHTWVTGGAVDEVFPRIQPLGAAMVEGKPVVIYPGDEGEKAGVKKGDIIETIDGKPLREVMASLRPYAAGSTEAALETRLLRLALGGKVGSQAVLGLHGPDGPRQVTLTRQPPGRAVPGGEEPPYRMLEAGLGYVDLRVLEVSQVDAMFEAMRGTRAIIFDMRGYPRGTAWAIAPRLDSKPGTTYGAMFQRRLLSGLEPEDRDARYLFMQALPESDDWKYQGKTFMLIDADAISQAEHTGLFFEAANDTEFIGTNTSGANGDVTAVCLPGNVCVGFTGHDVRHADGRQLQRIGIEPHVRVAPTIAGVRAGKDEVLEAAIARAKAATGLR